MISVAYIIDSSVHISYISGPASRVDSPPKSPVTVTDEAMKLMLVRFGRSIANEIRSALNDTEEKLVTLLDAQGLKLTCRTLWALFLFFIVIFVFVFCFFLLDYVDFCGELCSRSFV